MEALAFTSIGKVRKKIDMNSPTTDMLICEFESLVAAVPGLPVVITGTIESADIGGRMTGKYMSALMDTAKINKESSNVLLLNRAQDEFQCLQTRAMSQFLRDISGNIPESLTNPHTTDAVQNSFEKALKEPNLGRFQDGPSRLRFRATYVDSYMSVSRNQDNEVFVYLRE